MPILGLDIGGANIKASDGLVRSASVAFPLWKHSEQLSERLAKLIADFPEVDGLAVTMTGELADCFATKGEGVGRILEAVVAAAAGRPVAVWQTGGEFCSIEDALELVPLVAAANWHALATWVGRMVPDESAVLIDLGSTTCDIIPLLDGYPVPAETTDRGRLASGELVYAGVRRTPLCALADSVLLKGERCRTAAELFATTLDAFLLLGDIPEDPSNMDTANGRPMTVVDAHDRMARMVCADRDELSLEEAVGMAKEFRVHFVGRIAAALRGVLSRQSRPTQTVILSGEGEFVTRRLTTGPSHEPGLNASFATDPPKLFSLGELLGAAHSMAACAYALARLCSERL